MRVHGSEIRVCHVHLSAGGIFHEGIHIAVVQALMALVTSGAGPAHHAPVSSIYPGDPVCDGRHLTSGELDGRPATLVWTEAGTTVRRVTVFFDAAGAPIQYSELMTSGQAGGFQQPNAYRFVHLDFAADTAVVDIQHADGERIEEQRDLRDVLTSPTLGMPAETIRAVRSTCTEL